MARIDGLTRSLHETVALLQRFGERAWADTIAGDLRYIEAGDGEGLRRLLGRFGGMGSFNDLYLDPRNGHRITREEGGAANDRLSLLRDAIWAEATALDREGA